MPKYRLMIDLEFVGNVEINKEKGKRKISYFNLFNTPSLLSSTCYHISAWDGVTEAQKKRDMRNEVRIQSLVGARPCRDYKAT